MNDFPTGPSQPQETRLSPEFAKRMRDIQERAKGLSPDEIAALPVEEGLDEHGDPVVTKFVTRAHWPDGRPMYATVDKDIAEKLKANGDLDERWRMHTPKSGSVTNRYVIIARSNAGRIRTVPNDMIGFARRSPGEGQKLILKDGNIADLRSTNIEVVPSKRDRAFQVPKLHFTNTPLDATTEAWMTAKQVELRGVSQRVIKSEPFHYGKHSDGSEIALKFVTCKEKYRHTEAGDWRYVIMDKEVGEGFASRPHPEGDRTWSLAFHEDGTPEELIIGCNGQPQLARVVYGLIYPDVVLSGRCAISTKNHNTLDMRRSNLGPIDNAGKGRRPRKK